MIKAGIVGASGYAGSELVRLLYSHPEVQIAGVSSVKSEGKPLSELYPAYRTLCDAVLKSEAEVVAQSDVVFAALPHGISQTLAKTCMEQGKAFIDLGADFRLSKEEDYKEWYGGTYDDEALHVQAVYGLPELFRDRVVQTKLIANPGCYPTSIALGLYPALKEGLVNTDSIIIDSKSGVTGAGKGLTDNTHYPECNEAFAPYKIAAHRHTPEIEQTLSIAAGEKIRVLFTPHLLPVNRGILSTCYVRMKGSFAKIREAYETAYQKEYFVRLLPDGAIANIKTVKCSNFCDISLHADERTNTLIVVSAIDNMVKGAAGQAIQNMNLLFGLDETTGLDLIPPAF